MNHNSENLFLKMISALGIISVCVYSLMQPQSTEDILTSLLILVVVFYIFRIFFILTDKRLWVEDVMIDKDRVMHEIEIDKDFVGLALGDYLCNKYFRKSLDSMVENAFSWSKDFEASGALPNIKRYTHHNVLNLARQIHEADSSMLEKSKMLKRYLTVSSIVFDFKLPRSMVQIDEVATRILVSYLTYTKMLTIKGVIEFYTELFSEDKREIYNPEQRAHQRRMVKATEEAVRYISYFHDSRAPSFHQFKKFLEHNHSQLLAFADEESSDIELKKVMTMAHASCGVAIPRDWVGVDHFVLDYMIRGGVYWSFEKPRLSVVESSLGTPQAPEVSDEGVYDRPKLRLVDGQDFL